MSTPWCVHRAAPHPTTPSPQIGFLGPAFFLTQLGNITTVKGAVACMMAAQGLDAFSQVRRNAVVRGGGVVGEDKCSCEAFCNSPESWSQQGSLPPVGRGATDGAG